MTEAVPGAEPPVLAEPTDAPGEVEDDDGWPQLSDLELEVCVSSKLPQDRRAPGQSRPARPPRADA